MTFDQFKQWLAQLAAQANKEDPNGEVQKMVAKLTRNTGPGTTGTTDVIDVGGVNRLSDTTKYTGMHKERFDAEGKGKGISGREDVHENSG
ncbi:hypothetical protein RvY_01976 [Ramazzottius varieornatus]|uniref:Uncharacterized protein n=1 Tax=Ramazzottius varieornatus TaxID=947166 RepID=A0A1D1ULZ1_RAMVA|nr:hypothetical protein RvY_01976 [Ramazzottius varieornatus]